MWFEVWCVLAYYETDVGIRGYLMLLVKAILSGDYERLKSRKYIREIITHQEEYRVVLNTSITQSTLHENSSLYDTILEYPLTIDQRKAIVLDEDSNLILASAGTGKTSTIIAKILHLLANERYKPEEILTIAFTNAAADEIEGRLKSKTNASIAVSTFHKVGMSIIAVAEGKKPSIASYSDDIVLKIKHIETLLNTLAENQEYQKRLLSFIAFHRYPVQQLWTFSTLSEYKNYIESQELRSMNGQLVKSYGELCIANWLCMNTITYSYEQEYEYQVSSKTAKQYQPDFYLPEHRIYIEYYGLDKKGNTAPNINKEEYNKQLLWKRELHKQYNTTLIELYYWQLQDGTLLDTLEAELKEYNVTGNVIDPAVALTQLNNHGSVHSVAKLFATVLTLYKGNGSSMNDTIDASDLPDSKRLEEFLWLFKRLYNEYERWNTEAGVIDFEDMIIRATNHVKADHVNLPIKYIIVDEFQDISPVRAALLKALREMSVDIALYCVGDDWQSIYRFAGSDIGIINQFEKWYGTNCKSTLTMTHRICQSTSDVSSSFVQRNPNQSRKHVQSLKESCNESLVVHGLDPLVDKWQQGIDLFYNELSKTSTVLILERYNHQLPNSERLAALRRANPLVEIKSSTVHSAKGLEADYTLLGVDSGKWGFPCATENDPLINLVLTKTDDYPYSEERRLFYVALTRARRKTVILSNTLRARSVFVEEILSRYKDAVQLSGSVCKERKCEKCDSGLMLPRDGRYGKFYGCSNYPYCNATCSPDSIRYARIDLRG
jgi:DNA helicase-4